MSKTLTRFELNEVEVEQEPVPELLMRLKRDHGLFREYLLEVERQSDLGNLHTAMSWVSLIRPKILNHFVTEEERLMAVTSQEGETRVRERVSEIMQEHRNLAEFLTTKLPYLTELNPAGAKEEFDDFVMRLKRQMGSEEQLAFPLVWEAGLAQAKRRLGQKSIPSSQKTETREVRNFRSQQAGLLVK